MVEKGFSGLFFFFFVAPVFSPFVFEKTIYLEWLAIFFNPYFWFWVSQKKIPQTRFLSYSLAAFPVILIHPFLSLKFATLLLTVAFLNYSWERKVFFLPHFLGLSIIVAIFQFLAFLFLPEWAVILGPENLARTIWGSFATPAFSNFSPIFVLPRVSGLSREAGFFSALIIAFLFITYLEFKDRGSFSPFSKKTVLLAALGYLLSFSKISFALWVVFLLSHLKMFINKSPITLVVFAFVLSLVLFWSGKENFLLAWENQSLLHRFGGYILIPDIDSGQLLFGVSRLEEIDSSFGKAMASSFGDAVGFSGFILHNGLIVVLCYVAFLHFLGVSATGVLVLLVLTINTTPDTNQNFVALGYFVAFVFFRSMRYSSMAQGTVIKQERFNGYVPPRKIFGVKYSVALHGCQFSGR